MTSNRERAERRRRDAVTHVAKDHADAERFDAAFWAAMSGDQKVEALWTMVLEARVLKGMDGDEPRLQRSVCRVQRA